MDGEEVKDISTLAKVKTVEEMIPKPAKNQIGGSQPKIGEEQYRIIEECFRMDGTVEEACILAGISVPSYYKHRNEHPEVARRMDIARQFPKMIARAAIQRRIRQGDSKTAMEFIKLRDRRYRPDGPGEIDPNEPSANRPVVQFISVASNEGDNTTNPDTQTSTKQNSAYDISVSSGDIGRETEIEEIEETPRENDEQVLRSIDSSNFSSD